MKRSSYWLPYVCGFRTQCPPWGRKPSPVRVTARLAGDRELEASGRRQAARSGQSQHRSKETALYHQPFAIVTE